MNLRCRAGQLPFTHHAMRVRPGAKPVRWIFAEVGGRAVEVAARLRMARVEALARFDHVSRPAHSRAVVEQLDVSSVAPRLPGCKFVPLRFKLLEAGWIAGVRA